MHATVTTSRVEDAIDVATAVRDDHKVVDIVPALARSETLKRVNRSVWQIQRTRSAETAVLRVERRSDCARHPE